MRSIHPDYPSMVKEVRRQLALSQEDLARLRTPSRKIASFLILLEHVPW